MADIIILTANELNLPAHDRIRVINVNNKDTIRQLKHTQSPLVVTNLPIMVILNKDGKPCLASLDLLPVILNKH